MISERARKRIIENIGITEFRKIIQDYFKDVEEEKKLWSATIEIFHENVKTFYSNLLLLHKLLSKKEYNTKRLLDLGCGYGIFTKLIGDLLDFDEIYGIDYEEKVLTEAANLGIKTIKSDLNDKIPLPDEYFQVCLSFGVLDHLIWWDNFFSEVNRILDNEGLLVIYITNLAGWDSRLSLLFGYQPRHIEISRRKLFGTNKLYLKYSSSTAGHIRTSTLRAIIEIAQYYRFTEIKKWGLRSPVKNLLIRSIDKIASFFPNLSSRYLIIFKKVKKY